ncbi:MAG: hypothetical protein ACFFDN_11530 [Candidatus Hodarchaeota archaeon]
MNFCDHCGKVLYDQCEICPQCGSLVDIKIVSQQKVVPPSEVGLSKTLGTLAIILSFIPILGLVFGILAIYFGYKNKENTGLILGILTIIISSLLSILYIFLTINYMKH